MNLGGLKFFYADVSNTSRPPVPSDVPTSATDVVLVRHGETTWNRERRIQGQLDSALNEVGLLQAKAVANRLASFSLPFDAIYSSDLSRAADTAQAIALSLGHADVILEASLRERHAGCLQGLTNLEALEQLPEAYRSFLSRDLHTAIEGGGESLRNLSERVVGCVENICNKHRGRRVVVVSHGGALISVYKHITGKNPPSSILNASINVIRVCEVKGWDIIAWGVSDHVPHVRRTFGGTADSA